MYKVLLLGLAIAIGWPAAAEPTSETATLQALQQGLQQNISELKESKGELKAVSEFRIKEQAQAFRNTLKQALEEDNPNADVLLPYVQKHQQQLQAFVQYINNEMARISAQLGSDNDAPLMLELSRRNLEKTDFYRDQLDLLNWADRLKADTSSERQVLTEQLQNQAAHLQSLVSYNQQQMSALVEDVNEAGKDASSEQRAQLGVLKERLNNNSAALGADISMLDSLGVDTNALKQSLFAVSGNITQDVFNVSFVSQLFGNWLHVAETSIVENGPSLAVKLLVFLVILFCAHLLAKLTERLVRKAVSTSKLNFSKLLQDFFGGLSGKVVMTIGLLIALSQLGFELGPLLAGFGIAGVIIGFALQDTLSNFASGMMILVYRPYDVGDLINAAGVTGRVSHMSLVSTTIKTLDNQRLIVPNNKIWGDTINNITAERHRRVDMTFGIGYSDDIEKAEKVLQEIVSQHPKVLQHPEPVVRLHLLNESSVDFIVRPWVQPDDYWIVYWDITRAVKMRFDAENITIPFPQRDVHFYRG
ncbi:mechanosensitive ion channel [Shewanella sp. C32]|uniref:Small-conductance mechanosensitive channel n=1 Tax=Shewanella electrica TaxID=515560 RepID=A0ABT2FME3_9GAMM|nr:mechanosensitive ion channel family protein [Shewanella electrica]MCH1926128.1 mechanosensitive ion channel [Shewanella electrica]MCS4557503.1 mechanosensitive ion channel [Shewanella electrica]